MLEEELDLNFFKENNFTRKICSNCNSPFWSLGEEHLCGDSSCVDFKFINNPPTKKKYTITEFRDLFLTFFKKRGHTVLKRYPVIARWRDDIYLTIASIADFQPHVTSGTVEPPANPLAISQPSIRLVDIDEVGISGRHLTNFEMMGHHAFNTEEKEIYWKEETIQYCNEMLIKDLGVSQEKITYKENPWTGGGNAGPALEVLVEGLELATLVFMNMIQNENGTVKIKGEKYSKMPLRIVDTGYGLERYVWISNGTETIYDSIYPKLIQEIKDGCKIEKMENIYAIADHARCLAFMLGDGIVPSNVKAGYLARLVIRKALRLIQEIKLDMDISEIVEKQLDSLIDFPELNENRGKIFEVLLLEKKRYTETIKKGTHLVKKFGKKKMNIKELIDFYDTYGLHPSIVQDVGKGLGIEIEIPENFFGLVAERHAKEEKTIEKVEKIKLPNTKLLYYDNEYLKEFDAVVIYSNDNKVILDRTTFYPEGGGQPCDLGFLNTDEQSFSVTDVQKTGNIIIHFIDGKINVGEIVHGRIDWKRRVAIMRNHTGTHILAGSTREILGNHIWQAGSQLSEKQARLDITHYTRITDEQLKIIEMRVNEIVLKNLPLDKLFLERNIAEKRHGFRLYQGGAPAGKDIRVVRISDFEAQACGGTHLNSTLEVGAFKILRTERVQDGIERFVFSTGLAAIENIQMNENYLEKSSKVISVLPYQLPKTVKRFFEEWKSQKKEIDSLKEKIAGFEVKKLKDEAIQVNNIGIVTKISKSEMSDLIKLAGELTKDKNVIAILGSDKGGGKIVVACSKNLEIDCTEIAKESAKIIGGSGGGRKDFAQAGGSFSGNIGEAIKFAEKMVKKVCMEY